jgi:hydrogenase maturation factor
MPSVLRNVDEGVVEGEDRGEKVNYDFLIGEKWILIRTSYVVEIIDGEEAKKDGNKLRRFA